MRTHAVVLTFATLLLGTHVLEIQAKPEFWDAFYTEKYIAAHGTQLNTLDSASSPERRGGTAAYATGTSMGVARATPTVRIFMTK